jgi:hypothetical protein
VCGVLGTVVSVDDGVDALAELVLTFWLLVMGVNARRWSEQAAPAERA